MTAAKTRKWSREFDEKEILERLGAIREASGLFALPNGNFLSAYPGKPGRICLMLTRRDNSDTRSRHMQRNFGAKQLELMREWISSGGVVSAEQKRKLLIAAAPDLLAFAERVAEYWHYRDDDERSLLQVVADIEEDARAVIKKAGLES